MRISALAISAPTLVAAAAQLTAPVCTDASYAWTTNSLGQNPCVVAAYLEAVCSGDGSFSIPPIGRGQHYTGPNGESTDAADAHDVCKCNTVVYSLLAACAACQGGTWMQWSFWSLNCTTVLPDGVYSKNIPDGTLVPHWAYLPVSQTDLWSNVSAHQASQESAPESSASSSATLTALGSLNTPTTSPNALPSSSPSSGTYHSFSVIIVYAIVGAFAFNTLFAP